MDNILMTKPTVGKTKVGRIDKEIKTLKESLKIVRKSSYGSRCKVFANGCPTCGKWLLHDLLEDFLAQWEWNKKND